MWLKLLGSKLFWSQKNESALAGTNRLVKDRSWKSGSIPERSLTKLASVSSTLGYLTNYHVSRVSVCLMFDFSATWGVSWNYGLVVWNVKFSPNPLVPMTIKKKKTTFSATHQLKCHSHLQIKAYMQYPWRLFVHPLMMNILSKNFSISDRKCRSREVWHGESGT